LDLGSSRELIVYKKYGGTKTQCDGYSFSSKLEASVYSILKNRENLGEIKIIQVQDHVYMSLSRVLYIPDFKCLEVASGAFFWVEAKGYANDRWPTKKKLWKFYGPGKLEIWKGTYQRPFLDEVIIPKTLMGSRKCNYCGQENPGPETDEK
jgi:hypothetical protein